MLIVIDFVSLTLSFFYTLNTFMTESFYFLLIYFFIVVFFIYIIYIKEKISTINRAAMGGELVMLWPIFFSFPFVEGLILTYLN